VLGLVSVIEGIGGGKGVLLEQFAVGTLELL